MRKIIHYVQNYLMLGIPFVLACMFWSSLYPESSFYSQASLLVKVIWTLLSFNTMFWFTVLVLFLFTLVLIPSIREITLRRLANLKERDEREQYITGKASRNTYIATLSLSLLLLFLSVFSLNVFYAPKKPDLNEKRSVTVNMGIHFAFLKKDEAKRAEGGQLVFSSDNYALSTSAMIVFLLSWQLIVFNLNARKALKGSK